MKTRVLLVDDERDFLDIMAERISARGMDVSTATCTRDGKWLKRIHLLLLRDSIVNVVMDV